MDSLLAQYGLAPIWGSMFSSGLCLGFYRGISCSEPCKARSLGRSGPGRRDSSLNAIQAKKVDPWIYIYIYIYICTSTYTYIYIYIQYIYIYNIYIYVHSRIICPKGLPRITISYFEWESVRNMPKCSKHSFEHTLKKCFFMKYLDVRPCFQDAQICIHLL